MNITATPTHTGRDTSSTATRAEITTALRRRIAREVHTPGEAGYEEARAGEQYVDRLRDAVPPMIDMWGVMPFAEAAVRDGRFVYHCVGVAMAPGDDVTVRVHADSLKASLAAHLSDQIYLNFVDGLERRRRTADGIADGMHQRVVDVHRWFDPGETLRFGVTSPC